MKINLSLLLGLGLLTSMSASQVTENSQIKFWPSNAEKMGDTFTQKFDDDAIVIDFKDKDNVDNYLHINYGKIPLSDYLPGGYFEIDAEIDKPLLKIGTTIGQEKRFWQTRVQVTGPVVMKQGRHKYRFYLDCMPKERMDKNEDSLYIFIQDTGGLSKGDANLKIYDTKLVKSNPNWINEKNECYRIQYNWRKLPEVAKYYRGKYDLVVNENEVLNNPFFSKVSLNGDYQKSYIGDVTWDYQKLSDDSFAKADTKLENAQIVSIPEKETPNQSGGHYLYKKDFKLDYKAGDKVFLKIGDLADSANIYINGELVGTQSSVRKRHDWMLRNGSRQSSTWGKPTKEVMKFQHFERCGIKFPFDEKTIPDDEMLMLPIYMGEYEWNYVYDISDYLKNGNNTLAIKLYGNPVIGFWIFRNTEYRTSKNTFGIFGDIELLVDSQNAFVNVEDVISGSVDKNGNAIRSFAGQVNKKASKVILTGSNKNLEVQPDKDGFFDFQLELPCSFDKYNFVLTAFDENNNAIDSRNIEFNANVIETKNGKLFVNGDEFIIRGINGEIGVEWNNDRTLSRRQWLNRLNLYKNLGFNAVRLEGTGSIHVQDALDYGLMVMPVYAQGSCNTTEVMIGDLSKPDYEFNTDGHKEMTLMLEKYPNILIWNSGNENHTTPGYNDKVVMDEYLKTAQKYMKKFDRAKRPVTYANLDMFGNYWLFTDGQDVFGYNSYQENKEFEETMKAMYKAIKKPIVFTEWGFFDNEKKARDFRTNHVDEWEKNMRDKLAIMRNAEGSIGGFLYPYHTEMEDVRGREFLQEVMSPFTLSKEGNMIKFENQDVATLRKVSIRIVSPDNVVSSEWAEEIKPGRSIRIDFPEEYQKNPAELRIEMDFETHRGLKHRYIRMASRLK